MTGSSNNVLPFAIIVALGGFVFGLDAALIGGVIGYVETQFDLDPWQIGFIIGAPTLSAVFASLTVGFVSDKIGRKKLLIILAALYVISAILSAGAWSFWSLAIARAIGGYAFGALAQAPVYIAEISPAAARGRFVGINQMTIVVGLSAAFFSNLGFQMIAENLPVFADEPWRWMLGIETIPALVWLIGLFFVPESPRWLAVNGQPDEAEKVLHQLGLAEEAKALMAEVKSEASTSSPSLVAKTAALFSRSMWFTIAIGLIIAVVQQITGINVVLFYANTIFEQAGAGEDAAFVQAVFVGLTFVVFTIVALYLVDRVGRRPLMIAGLIGVSIALSTVSWGFYGASYALDNTAIQTLTSSTGPLSGADLSSLSGAGFTSDYDYKQAIIAAIGSDALRDNEAALLAAGMNGNPQLILFGILMFVASFAFSLGPIMWIYLAEIFPNEVRGIAISLITVFNSGTSWAVQQLFPIQLANMSIAVVFLWYATFGIIGLILVSWLMPETKGLTLEEITADMKRRSGQSGKKA